jgi:hypothetical protein
MRDWYPHTRPFASDMSRVPPCHVVLGGCQHLIHMRNTHAYHDLPHLDLRSFRVRTGTFHAYESHPRPHERLRLDAR